jgi:hypothetical protein
VLRTFALGVAIAIAATAVPSSAQSGRRIPNRRNTPPPAEPAQPAAPEGNPNATPAAPPVPESEKIPISTAKYVANFSIRAETCDAVVQACARELGESSIARPMPAGDLTRKKATDLAKGTTTGYVLWVQFSFDGVAIDDPMTTGRTVDALLVAHYVLFEPGTAKIRTQGRLYFASYDSVSRRGPSLGGINRSAQGLSPTETGLRIAAAVLGAIQKDLLPTP